MNNRPFTTKDLPKDERQLADIYQNSEIPTAIPNGPYRITMLTGRLPNISWLGHKKVFKDNRGHNTVLGIIPWGYFKVENLVLPNAATPSMILNYHGDILMDKIRDEIRQVEEGLYLGRFNSLKNGQLHFIGYFSLKKI